MIKTNRSAFHLMKIAALCLFLPALAMAAPGEGGGGQPDPLFCKMVGHWIGNGIRTQAVSGSRVMIHAVTDSEVVGDHLVSRNVITETPMDRYGSPIGTPRTYSRTYWIRGKDHSSSSTQPSIELIYELGFDEQVTSHGAFKDSVLNIEQRVGDETSGYLIRSQTEFMGSVTHYHETFWRGLQLVSRTEIKYERTALGKCTKNLSR